MLLKRAGNEKNGKWQQNKELEISLLIGLGFKLALVPIFHFPVFLPRNPFLIFVINVPHLLAAVNLADRSTPNRRTAINKFLKL